MINQKYRRILAPILFPLSLCYGLGVTVRNKLFDWKILKSVEFDFPVISVGNITVGGTGKTPHVEYLIELLSNKFKLGILSRGYKRLTKGFLLADKNKTHEDIGDESFQIFSKYKQIDVAVDEKRVNGIIQLKKKRKDLQVILLDDAFQHRYVKPGVSILLIDYYRPVFKDYYLPFGELRDCKDAIHRANIVIVTKVPDSIKPIEKRLWKKELKLFPYQFLYFSTYQYGKLIPVANNKNLKISLSEIKESSFALLVVAGIACPEPLVDYLKKFSKKVATLRFSDHHLYTSTDLQLIRRKFDSIQNKKKIIVTTEKDSVKLSGLTDIEYAIKDKIYYLPVRVEFLDEKKCDFDSHIVDYVAKNKKINRLHK